MPAAMTHIDWAGAHRDYIRSHLSPQDYLGSLRFRRFCKGKLPSLSTLKKHFRKLNQQKSAAGTKFTSATTGSVIPNPAAQLGDSKEVTVVRLTKQQVEGALRARRAAPSDRQRSAVTDRPVCFRFPSGATMEFFTPSPEVLALQALRAAAGGEA